ncbi:MAG TPA: MBL fold metallo-hydrolase [Candidatus Doudnabacteria bacterium]|nr:MBL fold metallo-hydrolase [Candidatus Doudnabacteria bacterium]
MQIHYFGLSSFKIITKEATVITDPFDKESGLVPPRGAADIVILAEKNNKLYNVTSGISGESFLISDPGEYDLKGVTVTGIPLLQDEGRYVTVYLIESEDISILNLTHVREWNIKQDDLEDLGEIDILILPVGSNSVLTPKLASQIAHDIEPKIVIPSHYDTDGLKLPNEKVDVFLKNFGGKAETMDKLIIKKKDLIQDKTQLVVLEALR